MILCTRNLGLCVVGLGLGVTLACSSTGGGPGGAPGPGSKDASAAADGARSTVEASVAPADPVALSSPGPYGVGTKELTFVDSSRKTPDNGTYPGAADRTLLTKVWYPAGDPAGGDGAAPATDGPFPVIAYAHGFISSRAEAEDLKRHLASHGYVVIAPDFPLSNGGAPGGPTVRDLASQPGDLAFVVQSVKALDGADQALAGAMDTARQGVAGLSLGGATTLLAVYHPTLHLPDVLAAVAYAPVACFFGEALYQHAVPTVVMGGTADELVPFDTIATRTQVLAPAPLTVVKLEGATHVGFMGIDIPDVTNSDAVIGCGAVQGAIGGSTNPPWVPALSAELDRGTDGGVLALATCGGVCAVPYVATMPGARQLELTREVTLAHFDAVLRGRKDAARFLEIALDPENDDLEITRRR